MKLLEVEGARAQVPHIAGNATGSVCQRQRQTHNVLTAMYVARKVRLASQ